VLQMSLRSSSSGFPYAPRHVAIVLTVASIVIVIAVPSEADVDSDDLLAVIEKRSNKQRYCGSQLVDALSVACAGSYNGMFKKQSKKNLGLLQQGKFSKCVIRYCVLTSLFHNL